MRSSRPNNPSRFRLRNVLCLAAVAAVFIPFCTMAQEGPMEDSEGPLFVPIVPGEPAPPPPVPQVTPMDPTPSQPSGIPMLPLSGAGPLARPTPFIPSDIPPPAIQSRPVTVDYFEAGDSEPPNPSTTPRPVPVSRPSPTPRPSSAQTSTSAGTTQRATTGSKPAPRTPSTPKVSQAQISKLAESAARSRNDKTAEQLGWIYYNRDDFSSAAYWFEQAMEYNPGNSSSSYGLALSKFRGGELTTAESIARSRPADPKMKTLLGDINVRRAMDSYEAGRYRESIRHFERAQEYRPLSRNEQIVLAWDYRQTNRVAEAADMFERLYRARPDKASAEGLYSSLSKLKEYDRLNSIAEQVPGPLTGIYETYEPQEYYKASLFRAAYDSEGEKVYPVLENITAPSAEIGVAYRQKSGQSGESALTEVRAPYVEVKFSPANRAEITARISRINLDSGDLNPGANVGTPPLVFTPYSFTPTTELNGLFDFSIRFEYQDWITPYFEIGSTPLNGPIQGRPVGRAGLTYRHANGYLQGEFFSRSIKQSILSYVGMVDPYTGDTWGRVTETGFAASIFQSVAKDWTIFLGGSIGQITGQNVQKNDHVAFTAAIAKEMNIEGFEYFTFGPAFSYEAYENNQNFFTYGNGGYFSPDYIVQGILGVNFLTTEGQEWLVRGSASAGLQNNQQSGAPYFPLNPDGRNYPAPGSSSTGVALVELDGAYLIAPNWVVGTSLAYTVTADYNEGWASIYVRYIFEPRNGLLRSDLTSGAGMFR